MTENLFGALGVPSLLVAALTRAGIDTPFPIQADTLPDTLRGRDVLGRGKTGSGKTLAFSIPMVARLADGGRPQARRPRGLVLAPTRELATQISTAMQPLAAAYGMRLTTVFGGVSQQRQVQALSTGVDILVACPGRLEDLMQQGHVTLDAVEITVLDEADHMADLGFLPVVTRLLAKTPTGGQRLLFSATLDNGVDKLVKRFLQNEVLHSVDEATSPVAAMTHHVFETADVEAKKQLVHTLASGQGRRILFLRTKHQAKKLAKQLTAAGIPAVDLHGNLSQPQRDRNLAAFSAGDAKVLVATDVAARGVHVDNVELVIHVDPPAEHKAYLHRSGRTARAGEEGDVVTIMLPAQRSDVASMLRKAAISATPERVTPESAVVVALVGEVAPYVKPEPVGRPAQGGGRSGAPRGAGSGQGGGRSGGQRDRSGRPRRSGDAVAGRSGSARGRASNAAGSGTGRAGGAGGATRTGTAARAGSTGRSDAASQNRQRSAPTYSTSTPAAGSAGRRRTGRRAQG